MTLRQNGWRRLSSLGARPPETPPQIRSAPDYEITGRPNSPPPELLATTVRQIRCSGNTTFEEGYGTKELLAKSDYFGTILEPPLVTSQPRLVLNGVSQACLSSETSPRDSEPNFLIRLAASHLE